MNYMDVGLPHTEFYPKKQLISPPRQIPMSGLSRKYMGLEPVSRFEIESIVNRLSRPKVVEEVSVDRERAPRAARPATKGTGRFAGRKRMSSAQICRMVDRLCSKGRPKEAEETLAEGQEEGDGGAEKEMDTTQPDPEGEDRDGHVTDGSSSKLTRQDGFRHRESRVDSQADLLQFTNTGKEMASSRRESERLKEGSIKASVRLPSAQVAGKEHHPVRRDILRSREQQCSPIPYAKPTLFQRSPSLLLKSFKTGPSSPRLMSALAKVAPTSPWMGVVPTPAQRSAKVKTFPKTDEGRSGNTKFESRLQLPIEELDDQVINKVAKINKSPRHSK